MFISVFFVIIAIMVTQQALKIAQGVIIVPLTGLLTIIDPIGIVLTETVVIEKRQHCQHEQLIATNPELNRDLIEVVQSEIIMKDLLIER